MKNKFLLAAALLAALVTVASAANPVNVVVSADDTDVALLIRYVGSETSATVEVNAGGDLLFEAAAAADTTINPAATNYCGATEGTIDLSSPETTCNSLGEVVDVINTSANWQAVIVDGLRSDTVDNVLLDAGPDQATKVDGLAIYFTSADKDFTSRALLPANCQTDIRCFTANPNAGAPLLERPAGNTQTVLQWLAGYLTTDSGGTATFTVYAVKERNKEAGSTATERTIFTGVGGATTADKQWTQFQNVPLVTQKGEKMIVRMSATGTTSTFRMQAFGYQE
jgi:hypothetical protein